MWLLVGFILFSSSQGAKDNPSPQNNQLGLVAMGTEHDLEHDLL